MREVIPGLDHVSRMIRLSLKGFENDIYDGWLDHPTETDRLLVLADYIEEHGVSTYHMTTEELCEELRYVHMFAESGGYKEFHEYSERITFVNQQDHGDYLQGQWFWADDVARVIYYGSFGNDNAPGADDYTIKEVYPNELDYRKAVIKWDETPEFVEDEYEEEP